jgi:hypothetical protein
VDAVPPLTLGRSLPQVRVDGHPRNADRPHDLGDRRHMACPTARPPAVRARTAYRGKRQVPSVAGTASPATDGGRSREQDAVLHASRANRALADVAKTSLVKRRWEHRCASAIHALPTVSKPVSESSSRNVPTSTGSAPACRQCRLSAKSNKVSFAANGRQPQRGHSSIESTACVPVCIGCGSTVHQALIAISVWLHCPLSSRTPTLTRCRYSTPTGREPRVVGGPRWMHGLRARSLW